MAPSVPPAYAKDERVLCFHHELLYEAKVLEYKHTEPNDKRTPLLYLVHYKGWKKTWDDWVPQDRLRKFTEENKELAQDLKREMDDSRARAAPKSATLKKKNAGSDFSSARGSEERHSSLPVTGRGSKRGRETEIEKVGGYYFIRSPSPGSCPDLDYYSTDFGGSEASMDATPYDTDVEFMIPCYDGTGDQPPPRRSNRKPIAKTHFDPTPYPVSKPKRLKLSKPKASTPDINALPAPDMAELKEVTTSVAAITTTKPLDINPQGAISIPASEMLENGQISQPDMDAGASISNAPSMGIVDAAQSPPSPDPSQAIPMPEIGSTISGSPVSENNVLLEVVGEPEPTPAFTAPIPLHPHIEMVDEAPSAITATDDTVESDSTVTVTNTNTSQREPRVIDNTPDLGNMAANDQMENSVPVHSLSDPKDADSASSSTLTPPPASGEERTPSPPPQAAIETQSTKAATKALQPKSILKAKVVGGRIKKSTRAARKAKSTPPTSLSSLGSPPRPSSTREVLGMDLPDSKNRELMNPRPPRPQPKLARQQEKKRREEEEIARGAPCKKPPFYLPEFNRYREEFSKNYFYAGIPADMPKRPRERMGKPKVSLERARWMQFLKAELAKGTPRVEINPKYLAMVAEEVKSTTTSSNSDANIQSRSSQGSEQASTERNSTASVAAASQSTQSSASSSGMLKRKANKIEEDTPKDPVAKPVPSKDQAIDKPPETQAPASKRLKTGMILKQDDLSQEEMFHSRPAVRLPISDHLKALLVDDWENVTKNLSLVPLPAPHPVSEILSTYFEEEKMKRRVGSAEMDLLEEIVAGVKEYFNQSIGRILLYRFEREQYFEIRKLWEGEGGKDWEGKGPADAYGAEHLCRLFVSMPELIGQTNMDQQSVNRLREELAKMTQWLGKHSQNYFTTDYEAQSQEYIEKARGTFLH